VVDGLTAVLRRARDLGFLGPGDPAPHLRHALAFAEAFEAIEGAAPEACCDLGAGGGVPGLVLASRWPATDMVLLESADRRCRFLREAIEGLGLAHASVAEGRAEELARATDYEGRFQLVTARSFGPPATTAECAARLLGPRGALIVSEPPSGAAGVRWPADGLARLGLGPAVAVDGSAHLVVIRHAAPCPDRYPRRNGVPAKRPLF